MNAVDVDDTALSIIDPVTFTAYVRAKNVSADNHETIYSLTPAQRRLEYTLDVTTEIFKLRFSYLDFKLFLTLIESTRKQLKLTD